MNVFVLLGYCTIFGIEKKEEEKLIDYFRRRTKYSEKKRKLINLRIIFR